MGEIMKIVSWNCGMAFYANKKYKKIRELDADIYVILEVNRPKVVDEDYKKFMKNSIYLERIYDNDDVNGRKKGIAIIAKDSIKIENNNWNLKSCNDFLSVRVNDSFDLIGVWTDEPYLPRTLKYLRTFKYKFISSNNIVMCDDFNIDVGNDSNEKDKDMFVRILRNYGYESIYHHFKKEKIGEESIDTFHRYDGDFHIDYLFAKPELITSFDVGSRIEYANNEDNHSDHVPLIFEIDI